MDMEDHHHQQQYSITDLRQLINNGPSSSTLFPTAELFPAATHQQQHYEMTMFSSQVASDNNIIMPPRCFHDFADSAPPNVAAATPTTTTTSASTPPLSGLEAENITGVTVVDHASTGRWPRQETLTLLEIRSRLDSKFKEANQKGPLWDELSRIMSEEHGYQRSGKKCREKFENLYKYYKKTKEGKAGRQDGKHYRFFRQLEALYGTTTITHENNNQPSSLPAEETNLFATNTPNLRFQTNQDMLIHSHNKQCDSLSLTNSTEFNTSSSSDDDDDDDNDHSIGEGPLKDNDSIEKRKKKKVSGRSRKVKIKDFIDLQMKKLVEKQEEWLEKLTKTLEQKEEERVVREEEWRKYEAERLEREHIFWAKERAWIEARDVALMDALQKITGGSEIIKSQNIQSLMRGENQNEDGTEILMMNAKDGNNKKRKENSRNCFYFDNNNNGHSSLYNQGGSAYCDINDQRQEIGRVQRNDGSSPSNSNAVAAESCFHPFLMSEGGNLWENYSLKVDKGNQNQ